MKIFSIVCALLFAILACVNMYVRNVNGAQYCCLMGMMWCIYLKLLHMEGK